MNTNEEEAIITLMETTSFGFDEICLVYNKVLTLKTVERILTSASLHKVSPLLIIEKLHSERGAHNAIGNEIYAR